MTKTRAITNAHRQIRKAGEAAVQARYEKFGADESNNVVLFSLVDSVEFVRGHYLGRPVIFRVNIASVNEETVEFTTTCLPVGSESIDSTVLSVDAPEIWSATFRRYKRGAPLILERIMVGEQLFIKPAAWIDVLIGLMIPVFFTLVLYFCLVLIKKPLAGSAYEYSALPLAQVLTLVLAVLCLRTQTAAQCVGKIEWVGRFNWKVWVSFCFFLILLKLIIGFVSEQVGLPDEPSMVNVAKAVSVGGQLLIMLVSSALFAPFLEELLYRHAALTPALRRLNRGWTMSAVFLACLLFSGAHVGYSNWTTYLELFELGILFSVARIISGGIALPILIHGCSNGWVVIQMAFLN